MEIVWAPWRMPFILGAKPVGCFLCETASVGVCEETLVLRLTPLSMVIMNRYPYIAGHLLVSPRRHVGNLMDLTSDEMTDLHETLRQTVETMQRAGNPQGFNLGMNLGKAAGAGVEDHLHYHIVPRYWGDNNAMNIFADVRIIPEDLIVTWKRLLPFFDGTH